MYLCSECGFSRTEIEQICMRRHAKKNDIKRGLKSCYFGLLLAGLLFISDPAPLFTVLEAINCLKYTVSSLTLNVFCHQQQYFSEHFSLPPFPHSIVTVSDIHLVSPKLLSFHSLIWTVRGHTALYYSYPYLIFSVFIY